MMDQKLLRKAKSLAARDYQVQLQEEVGLGGASIWIAFVPEMPSCAAQADSAEAARQALITVREDYIYSRLKRGVPVPDPERSPTNSTRRSATYKQPSSRSLTNAAASNP